MAERSDRDGNALRGLLKGWQELDPSGDGLTVARALKKLADPPNQGSHETLREVLAELFDLPTGKLPKSQALGLKLRSFEGRNADGYCFASKENRQKVKVWYVRPVARGAGTAGSAGAFSDDLGAWQGAEAQGTQTGTEGKSPRNPPQSPHPAGESDIEEGDA
jgi:hypothetical protein